MAAVPFRAGVPFFSQYDREGPSGTDVLAQHVSRLPSKGERMFGYCFLPPVMVGVIVQHLAEWQAHAVIAVPDTRTFWFPAVQQSIHPIDRRGAERGEGSLPVA